MLVAGCGLVSPGLPRAPANSQPVGLPQEENTRASSVHTKLLCAAPACFYGEKVGAPLLTCLVPHSRLQEWTPAAQDSATSSSPHPAAGGSSLQPLRPALSWVHRCPLPDQALSSFILLLTPHNTQPLGLKLHCRKRWKHSMEVKLRKDYSIIGRPQRLQSSLVVTKQTKDKERYYTNTDMHCPVYYRHTSQHLALPWCHACPSAAPQPQRANGHSHTRPVPPASQLHRRENRDLPRKYLRTFTCFLTLF